MLSWNFHFCRRRGEGNGNPLQYSCLEIPWTEEPGGLQSMGSLTVRHDWSGSSSSSSSSSINYIMVCMIPWFFLFEVLSFLKISLFFHSIKAKILVRREFHFKYFSRICFLLFSIPSTSNFLFLFLHKIWEVCFVYFRYAAIILWLIHSYFLFHYIF